jgi:hypothetical protein|tara:strand:- start:254 stop:520 length:267 start_codon:yes stop_codon:yes gene_type:complete
MNHEAIRALYSNVVTIDDTTGAKDNNGNNVEIDMDLVNAWVDPNAYKYKRQRAYSLLNQFEMQFDDKQNSTTTWQDAITAIKLANPKP